MQPEQATPTDEADPSEIEIDPMNSDSTDSTLPTDLNPSTATCRYPQWDQAPPNRYGVDS